MELIHLKSFYQIVTSGSFSKAAEELFVSQPALSRQIASLEKELGLQLFLRQGRGITLTDAGRRLFIYAEKVKNLLTEAEKEMVELKDLTTGEIVIAASTTIANYLLPKILADYHKKNPNIMISVQISNSSQVQQQVLENKADIGLIAGSVHQPGLYQEEFAKDEISLVVPANHVLTTIKEPSLEQLSKETFLCREEGSDTQRTITAFIKKHSLEISKKIILGSTEAIKRGIMNNMGISFLSKYSYQEELKQGVLIPHQNINFTRSFFLIYPKGSRLSPAGLAFSALMRKQHFFNHASISNTDTIL